MRKNRNVFALLLAAILAFSMVPAAALASTGEPVGQVYVTIDSSLSTSNQFTNEGWVDIYGDDSAIDIIQRFAESQYASATVDIAIGDSGYSFYVSEINDLAELEDGPQSGWMGSINDWFTADAFAFYTVANGDIEDGDTLSIQYTVSGYGADLGGTWENNDKTLKSLEIAPIGADSASANALLAPIFSSDTTDYSLCLPAGTDSVAITPTATNKNFQARIFVGGTEYKRTADIPVTDGTVITVVCGEIGWPTMNSWSSDTVAAETYTITVGWETWVKIDSSLSTSNQFTNEGWVDIYSDDSAIDIIQRFAESQYAGATVDIAIGNSGYSNYVSEINDLAEFENGAESGWMGLVNDWFTADAFAFYTVANGDIEDGDTLSIQYTVSGYGADLGGSFSENDKTLKALEVATPDIEPASTILSLSPSFTPGNNEYSLSLPLGTDSVNITPTATNKNFQVRIFLGGVEYKRTDSIPVSNGAVITVVCGEIGWPTMNSWSGSDDVPAETYTITVGWKQLAGDSRYETMEAISQEGFDDADTVIVATGENYPDALAAAGLAGINDAPILLTAQSSLSPEVSSEIVRLGAQNVIIAGGTGVVSSAIETQLDAVEGVTSVTRAFGDDRVATALDIYAMGGTDWSRTAIIATGFGFADALSIAPYAYATGSPIFLTGGAANTADINAATKAEITTSNFDKVVIVGGADVVSQGVEDELIAIFGDEAVTRLSGDDRYQTSADIAEFAVASGLTYENIAVATGANFPDALAGSALCGKNASVLLLVDDSAAGLFCVDNSITGKKSSIELGYFLGGDGVISPNLQETILNAELI